MADDPIGVLVPRDGVGRTFFIRTATDAAICKAGAPPPVGVGNEVLTIPGKGMARGVNGRLWVETRSVRVCDLTTNAAVRVGPKRKPVDRTGEGTALRSGTKIFFGEKEYVFYRFPR